jgi:hypothetical protein
MEYIPASAPLAESSRKVFNRNIGRWLKALEHPGTMLTPWLLKQPMKMMRGLRECSDIKATNTNHHMFISAVVAYIQHVMKDDTLLDIWKEIMYENSKPLKERYLTGKPTELQANKANITWAEILLVRDKLELSSTKLLLSIYTMIAPERGGDYYSCFMLHEDYEDEYPEKKKGNYLRMRHLEPWELYLNDYKTKKNYGTIKIILPNELSDLIAEYYATEAESVSDYLFENEKGEPFTRGTFSTWACRRLTEAFGRPMTLTTIRHAYISQMDFNKPIAELNVVAGSMGHTVESQRKYKWDGDEKAENEVVMPE